MHTYNAHSCKCCILHYHRMLWILQLLPFFVRHNFIDKMSSSTDNMTIKFKYPNFTSYWLHSSSYDYIIFISGVLYVDRNPPSLYSPFSQLPCNSLNSNYQLPLSTSSSPSKLLKIFKYIYKIPKNKTQPSITTPRPTSSFWLVEVLCCIMGVNHHRIASSSTRPTLSSTAGLKNLLVCRRSLLLVSIPLSKNHSRPSEDEGKATTCN